MQDPSEKFVGLNPRRPKGGGGGGSWSNTSCFFWITFLRVKQNQQDFIYSYLDKQQIGKGVKFELRLGNKERDR